MNDISYVHLTIININAYVLCIYIYYTIKTAKNKFAHERKIIMQKRVKIILDDIRLQPPGWMLFKSPEPFIEWRKNNPNVVIDMLSLDHDMGETFMSGYDAVKHIINNPDMHPEMIKRWSFHTDNPIGFQNMYLYVINAQECDVIPEDITIIKEKMNLIDGHMSYSGYTFVKQ